MTFSSPTVMLCISQIFKPAEILLTFPTSGSLLQNLNTEPYSNKTLKTKDTHANNLQQKFSKTKLYSSPIVLNPLTVFSTNQVRLTSLSFPIIILHTFYIFHI